MKKFFTLLVAIALSMTVANAQIGNGATKNMNELLKKFSTTQVTSPNALKAKSTPNKIDLEEGEHLAGFYTTDDLPDLTWGGYGITSAPGQLQAGAIFEDNVFRKFVGGKITKVRFALGANVPVAGLYIYEVSTNYEINTDEPLSFVDLSSYTAVVGWNDVTLTTPVTIEADKYYLIAYEYTQSNNSNDVIGYPLITDKDLEVDVEGDYGFLVYGNFGGAKQWERMVGYGSLCIQAVVNGGNFIDNDISLSSLSTDKYVNVGSTFNYSFNIVNSGNVLPTSYSLNVSIDGNVVGTLENPITLTNHKQKIDGSLTVPSGITLGNHTFSIQVATINGNVPTENIDDDVLQSSFTVYEGQVERQMHLIEQFTSVQCTYCPLGHDVLEALQEQKPNKYAWVAIHCAGMGADPFYLTDESSDYIESFSMPMGYMYPSANFNRYLYDSSLNSYGILALSLGYYSQYKDQAAKEFDDLVNSVYDALPAFATVGISTDYNASTRQLTIKVSGDAVKGAREILDGQRITVYLTEDGLVAKQLNQGTYINDYVHDNVLREIVSEQGFPYCGDFINWTSDQSYENDYTVTLDSSWNPDNMHVIAFISKSFALEDSDGWYWAPYNDAYVNNTNMVKVGSSTRINNSVIETNANETSRYTMDGRQLSSPAKGLNIIKMSDGTARKVIVR